MNEFWANNAPRRKTHQLTYTDTAPSRLIYKKVLPAGAGWHLLDLIPKKSKTLDKKTPNREPETVASGPAVAVALRLEDAALLLTLAGFNSKKKTRVEFHEFIRFLAALLVGGVSVSYVLKVSLLLALSCHRATRHDSSSTSSSGSSSSTSSTGSSSNSLASNGRGSLSSSFSSSTITSLSRVGVMEPYDGEQC